MAMMPLVVAGIVTVLLLTLLSAGILLRQTQQQEAYQRDVLQSLAAITTLDDLFSALQDMEAGSRGYLLTGDPDFRTQFDAALPAASEGLPRLRTLVGDNPTQRLALAELEPLLQGTIAQMRDSLALDRSQHNAILASVAAAKQQMNQVRTVLRTMSMEENRLLQLRQTQDRDTTRRSQRLILGLSLLASLVFALLISLLLRDIVLRRRLTEQFQHTSTLLHGVADSMAQGLVVLDSQLCLALWNKRWIKLLEVPAELVRQGASFGPVFASQIERDNEGLRDIHDQTLDQLMDVLRDNLRTQQNTRFTWQRSNGLWLEAQSQPTPDGRIVITYTDVTPLKRAEQRSGEQATRLSAVLAHASDAIIVINESGSIESFNRAAEELFGYSAAEVMQRNVRMLMPEPYGSSHDQYLRRYISTGERHAIGARRELEGLRRDGQVFPLELAVREMWLGPKRMFIATLRNISERRAMERMKNEFISTVSHELRTPLTSIAGSLGLLAGGVAGPLPEKIERLIAIAHKNSERLVRLINDLLDIEKIESGKMDFRFVRVSLAALVDQAIEANRGLAEPLAVTIRRGATVPDDDVLADTDRLMQVLTNLISNAVKFSPRQGAVTLLLEDRGATLRLNVHDDGPGIPETFRDQIFGKFAQADASDSRQKGGTGLGLNIAKRIIERHGGHIGFESDTSGGGTTFWIELQKWSEQPLAASADAAPAQVLVCEDDADVAAVLAQTLRGAGLTVDVAHSLRAARDLLARNGYEVLTLDLVLPDGDGLDLLRSLRDDPATNALPVIVVSGRIDAQHHLETSSALRVAGWLQKPVQPQELTAAVHSATRAQSAQLLQVLHVEDDIDVIGVVRMALQDVAHVVPVKTVGAAKELLRHQRFDAIVLDLALPDGSGLDLLEALRQQPGASAPVVIFSAQEPSPAVAAQVRAALIKSKASIDELVAVIKHHAQDYRDRNLHGGSEQ